MDVRYCDVVVGVTIPDIRSIWISVAPKRDGRNLGNNVARRSRVVALEELDQLKDRHSSPRGLLS